MKKLIPTEAQECIALVEWADLNKIPIIHIPNEAKIERKSYIDHNGVQKWFCPGGKKLNRMGRKKGVPDFFIPVTNFYGKFGGLFIEMKRRDLIGEKIPDDQTKWIKLLRENSYCAEIAYGWEQGQMIIEKYLDQIKNDYEHWYRKSIGW